ALPEAMADHGHVRMTLGSSLTGRKASTHRDRCSQDVKEIRGDDKRYQADRRFGTAPVHFAFNLVAAKTVEGMTLLERLPLTVGHVAVAIDPDAHQPVGVLRGRRRKKQSGSETEDRRVCADGNADRDGRGKDEQGLTAERSKRVAQ